MPVIKVWCLPLGQSEESLNCLHQAIVTAAVSIVEIGLKDENGIICLFPSDLMEYGLGEEIVIEIGDLRRLRGRFYDNICKITVRDQFAEAVGQAVKSLYPEARVECHIEVPVASDVFWTSD